MREEFGTHTLLTHVEVEQHCDDEEQEGPEAMQPPPPPPPPPPPLEVVVVDDGLALTRMAVHAPFVLPQKTLELYEPAALGDQVTLPPENDV